MRKVSVICYGEYKARLKRTQAKNSLSLQRIPIDLQSLKLIDFLLLFWSAQQHLFAVVGALAAMFKTSAHCEWKTSPCGNKLPSYAGRLPNG